MTTALTRRAAPGCVLKISSSKIPARPTLAGYELQRLSLLVRARQAAADQI